MPVTAQSLRAAADVLAHQVIDTPCLYSRTLSEITGAEVYLKFENLQFTASFKERGALVKLASLSPEERAASRYPPATTRRASLIMPGASASAPSSSCRATRRM